MKKLLILPLTAFCLFSSLKSNAAFELSQKTVSIDVSVANEDYQKYVFIRNKSGQKASLSWKLMRNSVPSDTGLVQFTICDNMNCYAQNQLIDDKQMGDISASDSGYFKFDIFARKKPSISNAILTILVTDTKTMLTDSLNIFVNFKQTAIESNQKEFKKAFVLNTTADNFNINPAHLSELKSLSIYSTEGKLVYNSALNLNNASIFIGFLTPGIYNAVMLTNSGELVSRKFAK